jgi:predicted amidohydrolase YtcJ
MKRLNVVPTSTFNGIDRDGIEYIDKYGGDIASRLLPFKTMMRAGVPIALGSDLYPPSPMFGLWMAVARKDGRTGRVIGAHEALSREEALRGYTVNPSYASFREDVSGTLEPGKLADLVVLSADILTVPDDEIRNLRSLLTLVGGRVTHKDPLFKSLVGTMN